MTHKSALLTDVLKSIQERGFSTLRFSYDDLTYQSIYSAFEAFLNSHDDLVNSGAAARYDALVENFFKDRAFSLKDQNYKLDAIKKNTEGYVSYSFQYMEGLYAYYLQHSDSALPPSLGTLIRCHDELNLACQSYFNDLLEGSGLRSYVVVTKVWKYIPVQRKPFLMPVHFDRTILTIVLNTRNPGIEEERLLIAPNLIRTREISAAASAWGSLPKHRPVASDFPLALCGLYAQEAIGLPPTPHCVEQLQNFEMDASRCSIVCFLVPWATADIPLNLYFAPIT